MNDFIAMDFETSGTNFRTDQIIEACVIVVRNGQITTIFNTLVTPTEELWAKGLDPKVTEITGHTLEDLENGMELNVLADILSVLLRPNLESLMPLVAYNALFDLSFVDTLLQSCVYDPIDNPILDPLTIARDRSQYPHKLGMMCKKYGIEVDEAHRAEDDTLALIDLVFAMMDEDETKREQHNWKPVDWYINKAGYLRKFEEPEWVPNYMELYPQGTLPTKTTNIKPPKKPLPKYDSVVTNNAGRRKKLPDFSTMPNTEFSKEFMPTAFINKHFQVVIDTHLDDPFSTDWSELVIQGVDTAEGFTVFNSVIEYLQKIRKLPTDCFNSYLDTPGEAVIEFRRPEQRNYTRIDEDPFAHKKGPIEISEDDLPF